MKPAQAVASFDSASAMVRATALFLHGRDFAYLGQSRTKALPVRASALLPTGGRRAAYSIAGALEGLRPGKLAEIDLEEVSAWVTGHYPRRRYPAVFLGSSNGALVHLAAATGAPWLPQTLLLPVRRWFANGSDPTDPLAAMQFGERVAPPLLRNNPDVVLHHMHDPTQDELMVRHMAYFRIKRTRLGRAYQHWLRDSLAPGAPVVLVEDRSRWPTTEVADRHVFQHGAQGGQGPKEYTGTNPTSTSPEAEWGFEPALADDVVAWAGRHGHPVRRVALDCPEALSAPVADLHRRWAAGRGATDRLLVESFALLDPYQVARAGATPFWTLFPVQPSLRRAADYLAARPQFERVDALLFNHGAFSAGLAPATEWRRVVESGRQPGQLLGVDAKRFPADFAALARYGPRLRRLPTAPRPPAVHELAEVLAGLADAPGIRITTAQPR